MTQEQFLIYLKERAKPFTWLLFPLFILVMGHGLTDIRWGFLYPLLWGVFFYNSFEDNLCFEYDQTKESYSYLQGSKSFLISLNFLFALLYLSSLLFSFDLKIVGINIFIIFLSLIISIVFKGKKAVQLVRFFKVPLLVGMIASATGKPLYVWPVFTALYFSLRPFVKFYLGERSKIVDPSFIAGLFIFKLVILLK